MPKTIVKKAASQFQTLNQSKTITETKTSKISLSHKLLIEIICLDNNTLQNIISKVILKLNTKYSADEVMESDLTFEGSSLFGEAAFVITKNYSKNADIATKFESKDIVLVPNYLNSFVANVPFIDLFIKNANKELKNPNLICFIDLKPDFLDDTIRQKQALLLEFLKNKKNSLIVPYSLPVENKIDSIVNKIISNI